MGFDPSLAEFRFGYGLSPSVPAPSSAEDMMRRLRGPDNMAVRFPMIGYDPILQRMARLEELVKARRKSPGPETREAYAKARRSMVDWARANQRKWIGRHLARRSWTRDAFRERLVAFWADHFTARGKSALGRWSTTPYVESAIRPNVTGRFADLLTSVVKAPLMLEALDQRYSRGPGSKVVKRRGGPGGLNENLARELLELHTLGVGGPYTQRDVRELAELLTGLTFTTPDGTGFRRNAAEPGSETVLGKTYGGGKASMADIDAVLQDLGTHPATAANIARKLVVHFVSDAPDPDLVAALTTRFVETGGDLLAVYEMFLSHPAAWQDGPGNLRPPFDWVSAAVRALAVPAPELWPSRHGRFFGRLPGALARMGQPYEAPQGPDGWPEEDDFWVTPQGLAGRLQWALNAPRLLVDDLPDPRDFVNMALGPRVNDRLRFAAYAAESRADGIGLILASPEFQRS